MGKQTGWVIAATEGATVDGRTITKEWIEQMAKSYSIDEYTAVIWPEHFRSSWGPFEGKNWGTVDEVKASKQGGKLRLFVKLTANDYLLEANKDGQKLFMSIEPNTDFKGSGKCYLQGLAVTDSPASTGTTRLKFSIGEKEIEHDYSHLETLLNTDFIANSVDNKTPSTEEQAKSLFSQLLNLFSTSTKAEAESNSAEEDNTMTPEQLDALMGKFGSLEEKIDGIETKFSNLESKVDKFSVPGEDDSGTTTNDGESGDGEQVNTITEEQFSKLTDSITGLTEKFTGIETKFNKLSQEVDGQEPDPAGQGESVSLV